MRTREQYKQDIEAIEEKYLWNLTREEWEAHYKENKKICEELKEQEFYNWLHEMTVGDHAHINRYSDVDPCTIIRKTATTLVVRQDKARKSDKWNPQWVIGGFSAICTNNEDQTDWWIIEEDPDGYVETFRWSKKHNCYRNTCGESLMPEWKYYYDYNF